MFDPTSFPPTEDDVEGFSMPLEMPLEPLPPEPPHKMYVLVRRDLSPGLRCAQGMHAVAEICMAHPQKAWHWNQNGNFMIVLEVDDVRELVEWSEWLRDEPFPVYRWHEPDLGNQLTAIAALPQPDRNSNFAVLPLAYRETWLDRLVRWTGER